MIDTLVGAASTSTSDPTANLLSGLIGAIIGAIVGGGLTLLGSVIVNRMERRAALRYEVYLIAADLVPRMDEFPRPRMNERHDTEKQLDTMSRLGAIAGRDVRRLTAEANDQWLKARNAAGRQDPSDVTSHLTNASNALDELLGFLQKKLD
jgi:hypothetical protein